MIELRNGNITWFDNGSQAVRNLLAILNQNVEYGFVDNDDMIAFCSELDELTKNFSTTLNESSDEDDEDYGLSTLASYFDGITGYLSLPGDPDMWSMIQFTRLYRQAVEKLGFAYLDAVDSRFNTYWVSITKPVSLVKSKSVRLALREALLRNVMKEVEDLSDDELSDYVAIPLRWRFQLLGLLSPSDNRYDRDFTITLILNMIDEEEVMNTGRKDVDAMLV